MSDIANAVENVEEELSFQELLDQSLVSLHTGDIVKGTVISVSGEEVNVNLGYKSDGIIPRGEYSSDPNAIPSKELQAGDEIEVAQTWNQGASSEAAVSFHHSQMWWLCGGQGMEKQQDLFLRKAVCDLGGGLLQS